MFIEKSMFTTGVKERVHNWVETDLEEALLIFLRSVQNDRVG